MAPLVVHRFIVLSAAPRLAAVAVALLMASVAVSPVACSRKATSALPTAPSDPPPVAQPIYVVLFTHIEDNTPGGALGTAANRTAYLTLRAALVDLGERARRSNVKWTLQPDWKLLEAARQYEDPATMASTGGRNLLQYLRDTLGVAIDPHSHEGGGYNYTDVAHLLTLLGVGGSTVIGGHIWDPALPQFQAWDRFRVPVSGVRYPIAMWRGDILMGSGTPNHVNDPIVSGVWRPKDRNHYFEDDPAGNIACVGAYKGDFPGITELVGFSRAGQAPSGCMLTASYHLRSADLLAPGGASALESSVLGPMAALDGSGQIELTDFSALVATWRQRFGGQGCTFPARTALTPPM